MLIDTKRLAIVLAIGASVMWVICSILVALSPGSMTTLTGHMLHMNLEHTGLAMSMTGFIIGLIGWAILAGGSAWLLGTIYNFMVGKSGKQSE